MEPDEDIYVETRTVACDGTDPALGHPRVFLNMGQAGEITCPYCSRHFILAEDAEPAAQH